MLEAGRPNKFKPIRTKTNIFNQLKVNEYYLPLKFLLIKNKFKKIYRELQFNSIRGIGAGKINFD